MGVRRILDIIIEKGINGLMTGIFKLGKKRVLKLGSSTYGQRFERRVFKCNKT